MKTSSIYSLFSRRTSTWHF